MIKLTVAACRWYVLSALFCSGLLWAQTYPSRPIRIVVFASVGTTTDLFARPIGQKLNERLGWTVIFDNRPGGNFTIGARAVTNSPADGYSLLYGGASLAIFHAVEQYKGTPQNADFMNELAFLARTADVGFAVIANPAFPPNTVLELMNYAKANPGKVQYATGGSTSTTKMLFEYLRQSAGNPGMTEIPYKEASAFMPDLVAGQVPVGVNAITGILPFVANGRVKVLGVVATKRSPLMPNVPTVGETGMPDFDGNAWFGLFIKAGTPPEIVARLNKEIVAVHQLPEIREQFLKLGGVATGSTPQEFKQRYEDDMRRWTQVMKAANMKFE